MNFYPISFSDVRTWTWVILKTMGWPPLRVTLFIVAFRIGGWCPSNVSLLFNMSTYVFSNLVFLQHEFDIANNFGYFKKQCTERDIPLLITEVVVPTLNRVATQNLFPVKIFSLSFVLIVISAITK